MKYMNEVWVGGKYNSNGGFVEGKCSDNEGDVGV